MESGESISENKFIVDSLLGVFQNRSIITEFERETVSTDVHSLRYTGGVESAFIKCVNGIVDTVTDVQCGILYQIWLRKFVYEVINTVNEKCKPALISKLPDPLSVTDQNVLYYVSGYMSRKIKTACARYAKLKHADEIINILATKEPAESEHFVDHYKKMD
jgi:hypothetical protein